MVGVTHTEPGPSNQGFEKKLAGDLSLNRRRTSRRWSLDRTADQGGQSTVESMPEDLAYAVLQPGTEATLAESEEAPAAPEESDQVLRVLEKSVDARNDDDLAVVQQATKDVKFFGTLTPQQHLELCRVMTHELVPKDAPIFSQGDEGTTFYVIYMGAAKVFVSDGRLPGQQGACVCVLEDGDSFGELALLGNGIRHATVVTAMPTQLLKVEKDAYERSLQKLHEEDLKMRMRFLQRVFLFSDSTDEDLKMLAKVITRKKYEKNSTIIRQGESTDNMYLLVHGRCRVLKSMSLSGTQQDMLSTMGRSSTASSTQGSSGFGASGTGFSAFSGDVNGQMLEICELTTQQYFGELALLAKNELTKKEEDQSGVVTAAKHGHTASVVSITPVEVLLLNKYDFYHHVDVRTQDMMTTYAEKFYFQEPDIRRSIHKQHRWDAYKKNLLKDVVKGR